MLGGGISRLQATGAMTAAMHAFAIFGSLLAIASGAQTGWPPIGWVVFCCAELFVSLVHLVFVALDVLSRRAVTKGTSADPPELDDQSPALAVVTRTIYGGRIFKFAASSALVSLIHLMLMVFYGTVWHWAMPGSQSDPLRAERSQLSFDTQMMGILVSSAFLMSHWFDTLTHHAASSVSQAAGLFKATSYPQQI